MMGIIILTTPFVISVWIIIGIQKDVTQNQGMEES